MVVFLNNDTDKYAPLVYDNKYYSLAHGYDTIYTKNTGIDYVPIIYAKNNESKTVYQPSVTFTGNPVAVNNNPCVLTDFWEENYATCNITFPYTSNSSEWSITFRIKHKSTGVVQRIFSQNKSYPSGIEITTDNKVALFLSNSTKSYNIGQPTTTNALTDGETYDITAYYRSAIYFISFTNINNPSDNGSASVSNQSGKIASTSTWRIGYDNQRKSGDCCFRGEIDFSASYGYTMNGNTEISFTLYGSPITVSSSNYDNAITRIRRFI